VIIEQTQNTGKIFTLPIAIDAYNGANKKRYNIRVKNRIDTFTFTTSAKPTLINVDADKILLTEKTDNKTAENYVQQWKYAPNYLDRREALSYFASNKMSELTEGLNDKYEGLREYTLTTLDENKSLLTAEIIAKIEKIANSDPSKKVKANAIELLSKQNDKKYLSLFTKYVSDSSYSVAGAALEGLTKLDSSNVYTLAKKYSTDAKGKLGSIVTESIMSNGTEADFDILANQYKNAPPDQNKIELSNSFTDYLIKVKTPDQVKRGANLILTFRNLIPEQYRQFIDPVFKQAFNKLSKAKKEEGNEGLAEYIDGLIK
jgi:aminopeptidase N